MNHQPTIEDIRAAHKRIEPIIHRTPVLTSRTLNGMIGAELFFKCENFQKIGAFKFRGACNTIFSLPDEVASKGVITHSSGNHAAAVAVAARERGIPAYIVMPSNAPRVKVEAVKGYGGIITFCEPNPEARERTAIEMIEERGAAYIHPYNDYRIIAGQGTAALELIEDVGDLDFILAPVSGGGLLSGTALTTKALLPQAKVIGCEPEKADDTFRSKQMGKIETNENPDTICDGLRTTLGDKTFPVVMDYVDEIVLVSDEVVIDAMRLYYERMKIVVEPSGAITLAALLAKKIDVVEKRVGVMISGGNVDLSVFFEEMERRLNG